MKLWQLGCLLAIVAFASAQNCTALLNTLDVKDTPTSCLCAVGYKWNATDVNCWRNCTDVPNSPGTNVNQGSCNCNSPYTWTVSQCLPPTIICSLIPFAVNNKDAYTCNCQVGFTFTGGICVINCVGLNHTSSSTPVSTAVCACAPGYTWDTDFFECDINCTAIANTVVNLTLHRSDVCQCAPGFT